MKEHLSIFASLFLIISSGCRTFSAPATMQAGYPTMTSTSAVNNESSPTAVLSLPTQPPTFTPFPTTPAITPLLNLHIGSTLGPGSPDGMVLVYVPAGNFLMGSADSDSQANSDEKPQHPVYLDAFWIDKTDVTNAMYEKCVQANICSLPSNIYRPVYGQYFGNAQYADYPVIEVTWDDARTYCYWMGRRLPTEAQWEKAARGTDGRIYPWGNSKPTCSLANFGGLVDGCVSNPSKVDAYHKGASLYGALNMAGNIWQWVADWYDENYYSSSPVNNPEGPVSGKERVLRGGSWVLTEGGIRSAIRFSFNPSLSLMDAGFRCALSN